MCLGTIGRVIRAWDAGGIPMGLVRGDAGDQEACLVYTPSVEPGAMVLVHLGFVVEVLRPADAAEPLDPLPDAARIQDPEATGAPSGTGRPA